MKPKPFEIKLIASPENYTSLREDFKVIGAFNPGVTSIKTEKGLETILYVRVAETPKDIKGKISLPYFHITNKENSPIKIDYDIVDRKECKHPICKKSVNLREGTARLRHLSLPRLLVLNENKTISKRMQEPIIYPAWEYERFGIEDVRITHLNEKYFIIYSNPHREFGINSHILVKEDVKSAENSKGVTSDNTSHPEVSGKDVVLFPEKVPSPSTTEMIQKGSALYVSFIRPNAFSGLSVPGMWVSYSPDLVHWGQNHRLTLSRNGEVTGTGSPPVKRPYGWLEAYHETTRKDGKVKYVTKLMTLHSKEPWKVLNLSPTLLERKDFNEILPDKGYVPNVVFTTGMIVDGARTDIYSGIDDQWTTLASFYTEDIDRFTKEK